MDKKKYIDVLTEQASKHSRPQEMALSDFCDYLIEFFSIDAFKAGTNEYSQHSGGWPNGILSYSRIVLLNHSRGCTWQQGSPYYRTLLNLRNYEQYID